MKIAMTRMRRTKPSESCWKETVKKLAAFSVDNKLAVINYRVPIVCSDKETELRLGEPKEPTRDRWQSAIIKLCDFFNVGDTLELLLLFLVGNRGELVDEPIFGTDCLPVSGADADEASTESLSLEDDIFDDRGRVLHPIIATSLVDEVTLLLYMRLL